MKGQSAEARRKRLEDGRCPVHGTAMVQVGLAEDGRTFVCGCPRQDCAIRGTAAGPDDPVTLLPEHAHLLGAPPGERLH